MKTKKSLILGSLSFLAFWALGTSNAKANDWQTVGLENFTSEQAGAYSITTNSDGIPYLSFSDHSLGGKIRVQKFDSNSWTDVGTPGFSQSWIYTSRIQTNPKSGEIYVAYSDRINLSYTITVKKFNGSDWELVGTAGLGSRAEGDNNNLGFAINPATGEPYVAYKDTYSNISVKKFNGSSWVDISSSPANDYSSYYLDLAFNPKTNEPYVAFSHGFGFSETKITVKKFDGSRWSLVGGSDAMGNFYSNLKMAINADGNPYVWYSAMLNSKEEGYIKKFDGSSWSDVGDPSFLDESLWNFNLFINPSNEFPFVVYRDHAASNITSVKKFNGTSWETVGSANLSNGNAYSSQITGNRFGDIFLVYEHYSSRKLTVKKYVYIETDTPTLASNTKGIGKKRITFVVSDFLVNTKKKWVTVRLNNRKTKVIRVRKAGNNMIVTIGLKYKKWPVGNYNLAMSYLYKSGKRKVRENLAYNNFLIVN
jgi:hypothetical protein